MGQGSFDHQAGLLEASSQPRGRPTERNLGDVKHAAEGNFAGRFNTLGSSVITGILTSKLRQFLKRSGFVVGVVRASRAGVEDAKKVYWYCRRNRQIRNYLRRNQLKNLQLGASNSLIAGWLNTDLLPTDPAVVSLKTERLIAHSIRESALLVNRI